MSRNMALAGIKVIEMAGLAPAPFCGMILSDFGAKVIRIDRKGSQTSDTLSRGKQSIAVDLKAAQGVNLVKRLCQSADVLVEPYRPGVMEKLGLGPDILMKENPRLIYARLTGFGQAGYYSERAGHDINYLAVSGVLSRLGRKHEKPYAPINLLADFAGGGLTCAFGIMMGLYERVTSNKGQLIDANMVEAAAYISSFLWKTSHFPIWGERGAGMLDGGAHFYDTYETSDGKYMSVGAIEPQFYAALLKGLSLTAEEVPQYGDANQFATFTRVFASKTQEEWCRIFDNVDACVMPVLDMNAAADHPHNKGRQAHFMSSQSKSMEPRPAPHLSPSTGRQECARHPPVGGDTVDVLKDAGLSTDEVQQLLENSVVEQSTDSKL